MGEDFYREEEMAELLGLKLVTLKKNRCTGVDHPPYKKIGRLILYPKLEYQKWIASIPLKRALSPST